jgi:hypothetical protein
MTPPSPASFSPFRPLPDPFVRSCYLCPELIVEIDDILQVEDMSTGPPKARLRIRPVQSASTRQVRRRPGCCTHSPCPISGPTDVGAATFLHSQPIPLRRRRGDVNAPRDTFDATVMFPGPVRRRRHVPKDPYRLRPRYMEHHHEMASSAFPLIDDLDFGVPPRTPMHSQMGSGIPMQPVRFYDLMPVWSTIHA